MGTIGNCLSFYIMRSTSLKDISSCFYMSVLALADMGEYLVLLFQKHCKRSSMLLVLMSVEKCFVIYFPFKSKTVCTVKTAKWISGIVGVILAGYDLQYLIISIAIVGKDGSVYCEFRVTHLNLMMFVDSALYSFLPFVLMFITNFAIVFKFTGAKCKSKEINSTESTNQALVKAATRGTAMVVSVSVTFLFLTAPTAMDGVYKDGIYLISICPCTVHT